jgi:hypothetical protein
MRASSVRSHHSVGRASRPETAAQDDAFRFQREQRLVRVPDLDGERLRQFFGRRRSNDREAAADEFDQCAIAFPRPIARRRGRDDWLQYGVGMDRQQFTDALRGDPHPFGGVRLRPDTTGAPL